MVVRLLLLILLGLAVPAMAATERHISTTGTDSGTCLPANPCRTLNYARTQVSSGDTLYFRGGSYPGMVLTTTDRVPNGGGENSRTVIAGYPNEIVTFTSQVTLSWSNATAGVSESTLQYVTFKNFRVTSGGMHIQGCGNQPGTSWPYTATCGIHHVRYEDIVVTNAGQSCILTANSAMSYIEYIRVTAHDCGGSHLDHGFYVSGLNLLFDGVEAYNNNGYGMHLYDNSSYCAGQHRCTTGTVIKNSSFHNNGINDGAGAVIGHGDDIQFYNNIVYSNPRGVEATFGNSDNTQIYNNTIYNNTGWGIIVGDTGSPSTQTNTKIKNNIILNNSSGAISIAQATGTTYATNMCPTLATGCAVTGNPAFEDAAGANFKLLAGSAARNAGTSLASIFTTDRIGAARGQGAGWDIGAYEYEEPGGVPPNGNPIYIAKTGSPSNSCIDAENPATPKLTIMDAICNCAKFPGKRHIVKAGTYTESLDTGVCAITGGSGPSYTDATTLETFSNDAVTIQSAAGYGMALWLRASESYIVFKGSSSNRLVFDGTGGGGNAIALYPGTHHIKFEYVEVKNAQSFENVYALNADNIEWYDAFIHHAAWDGIAVDGGAGWIIQRTLLYSNGLRGLRAPANTGTVTGMRLSESKIYSNGDNGVEIGTSTGTTLVNNVYYSNTGLGVQLKTGAVGAKVYFSSLYQDAVQCDSGATSAEIKNVISYGTGSGITNNCSASTATNYTSDPLYTNPGAGDLTLQNGSLAINAGTPLAGVTIDYAGSPRPDVTNGLVDIGAYERCCPSGTPPGTSVTVPGDRRRHAGMLF